MHFFRNHMVIHFHSVFDPVEHDTADVQVEDVVTLVGTDGDETITIEEIANPRTRPLS